MGTTPPRTLIADDQPDVLEALRLLLKGEGYETEAVTSPGDVLEAIRARNFDLLLMDLNYARDTTSGQEGLDLLSRVQAMDSTLPVVVMTAWGSLEVAVEAMHRGVRDFVLKPWENTRLLDTLRTQIENGYVAREKLRRSAEQNQELEDALEIQRRLLPTELPQIEGFQVSAAWRPARAVSGDYFDALRFDESRLALCIADVSGKGMPAALLMSNLQAVVKAFASETVSPSELCTRVNRVVSSNTPDDKFITFFYCLLDAKRKRLTYSNAGHNPGVVVRAGGEVLRLDRGGTVLGPFARCRFEQGEIAVESGDRVLLFTDGVTEAGNEAGEEFGEDRLIAMLSENRGIGADHLQRSLMEAVTEFSGGDFKDDATLIVCAVD
ncbi:MAG TPA: SpoIIE family protein phosphatase [Blastocatellia bacterium]|nr:SpoIIE family protein phosphatase [Blastocatellia bacterium]